MTMTTVLWFTGLSGSGKTTIALALKERLEAQNKTVEMIDGDVVREKFHPTLGFSREDIRTNNRLIAELAKVSLTDYVLVPIISPYREDRVMAKSIIGNTFLEIFIDCPLQKCIEKDVKGLYRKALQGEITNFIGIAESNPYESPENPALTIHTFQESLTESVSKVMHFLQQQRKLL